MAHNEIQARLAYLRQELQAERLSYGELAELQSLAEHIEPGDVELLEAAGVPEFSTDTEWVVEWSIDLSASTPQEAAEKAHAIQLDPDSIATVFVIHGEVSLGDGTVESQRWEVDLTENTVTRKD